MISDTSDFKVSSYILNIHAFPKLIHLAGICSRTRTRKDSGGMNIIFFEAQIKSKEAEDKKEALFFIFISRCF